MNSATRLFYFGYRHPLLRRIVSRILRLLFSCELGYPVVMGVGNSFEHNGLGIVISRKASLGSNCRIYQHVTIGSGKGGYPTIGNNVIIYSGATLCGKITIGDNVIIGANSFVN